MNKIIAIVGMSGSGKSVASTYLESMGYSKVYFGGVTMKKLKEEGLEVTPENEKMTLLHSHDGWRSVFQFPDPYVSEHNGITMVLECNGAFVSMCGIRPDGMGSPPVCVTR